MQLMMMVPWIVYVDDNDQRWVISYKHDVWRLKAQRQSSYQNNEVVLLWFNNTKVKTAPLFHKPDLTSQQNVSLQTTPTSPLPFRQQKQKDARMLPKCQRRHFGPMMTGSRTESSFCLVALEYFCLWLLIVISIHNIRRKTRCLKRLFLPCTLQKERESGGGEDR